MLALNRESVWRDHRPDIILATLTLLLAVYFAYFVKPWMPGSCSVFTLQVFFWITLISAWTVGVLRLVFSVTFHRLTMVGVMLLLIAMFVVDLAMLAASGNV